MAIDILHGTGYRIGASDRTLGGTTSDADGFVVLNMTSGNIFLVSGGLWSDGGTYPNSNFTSADFAAWVLS